MKSDGAVPPNTPTLRKTYTSKLKPTSEQEREVGRVVRWGRAVGSCVGPRGLGAAPHLVARRAGQERHQVPPRKGPEGPARERTNGNERRVPRMLALTVRLRTRTVRF